MQRLGRTVPYGMLVMDPNSLFRCALLFSMLVTSEAILSGHSYVQSPFLWRKRGQSVMLVIYCLWASRQGTVAFPAKHSSYVAAAGTYVVVLPHVKHEQSN
jgi:hypothetical protein